MISTKVHAQYDPIRMIHSCRKVSTFLPCSFYEHDTRDSTNPSQIEGLLAAETGIFKLLPATLSTIISSGWLVWGEATHTCRFSSRKDARSKVVISRGRISSVLCHSVYFFFRVLNRLLNNRLCKSDCYCSI